MASGPEGGGRVVYTGELVMHGAGRAGLVSVAGLALAGEWKNGQGVTESKRGRRLAGA